MWLAPKGALQPALFAWMLGTMLLYDTCYTIIGLVYSALLPEVTESDADRTGLQVSGSLFGLLGMLLGFIIPELFRPKAGASPSVLPLQVAMIVVGVVSALLIIATTLKVKERPEFTRVDKPLGVGPAIRFTFTSRSFLILAAANFMSVLMQSLLLGTLFYLADYVLQMNSMIVLAAVFIPLIVGVPLSNLIRGRLGVVRTNQLLLVIGGVALMLLTIVPAPLILVCLALAGFGLAGPQTLTNVLFAQVADEDELRSGVRRRAFFGVNAMLTKPAQSLALILMPFILEATGFITRIARRADYAGPAGQRALRHPFADGPDPGRGDDPGRAHLAGIPTAGEIPGKGSGRGAGATRRQARPIGSAMKSTVEQIRARFDNDVERFANLETAQSSTVDAPLSLELITQAAAATNPAATHVLDIGCGAGNYTLKLLGLLPDLNVTLVDLSAPMLERAVQRIRPATAGRITAAQADVRDLALGDHALTSSWPRPSSTTCGAMMNGKPSSPNATRRSCPAARSGSPT